MCPTVGKFSMMQQPDTRAEFSVQVKNIQGTLKDKNSILVKLM